MNPYLTRALKRFNLKIYPREDNTFVIYHRRGYDWGRFTVAELYRMLKHSESLIRKGDVNKIDYDTPANKKWKRRYHHIKRRMAKREIMSELNLRNEAFKSKWTHDFTGVPWYERLYWSHF